VSEPVGTPSPPTYGLNTSPPPAAPTDAGRATGRASGEGQGDGERASATHVSSTRSPTAAAPITAGARPVTPSTALVQPGQQHRLYDVLAAPLPSAPTDEATEDSSAGYGKWARAVLGGGAISVAAQLTSSDAAVPGMGRGTMTLLALVLLNVVGFTAGGIYLYARHRETM